MLLALASCSSPTGVDAGSEQLQSVAPVAVAPTPPPTPAEPPPPPKLSFSALDCERPDCVISLSFSHPVVDEDQLDSAPAPDVSFRPKLRGKFHWTSTTELAFTPSAPLTAGVGLIITVKDARATDGSVLPLDEQSATIGVSELMIAGKVVEWPVLAGFPRLVTPLTDGDAFGASGLMLVFDQSVDPNALKKKLEVVDASDGKKLAFTVDRPDTTAPMYDAELDLSLVARLHVPKLIDGQTIRVTVPSWEPGGKRPIATSDTRSFTARTNFDLTHASGEIDLQRLPLAATLDFTATTPIDHQDLQRALTIEPKPRDVSVSGWSERATLSMTLDPGVNYRLLVDGAKDVYGNRSKRISLRLRAQDLEPQIFAPAVGVMVERGAPRFPVRVVNSGPLTATVYRADLTHFLSPLEETSCTGEPIATRKVPVKFAVNETGVVDVPLAGLKGFLCVDVSGEGRGSEKVARTAFAHVQSSDVSATVKLLEGGVLVWATHLSDAKPIAKAKVELLGRDGRSLKKGTTDDDGLVRLSFTGVAIDEGEELVVVVSEKNDVAVTALSEQTLSHAWQFGLPEQTGAARLDAVLFTERGVYRPGETVHVKAILPSAGAAQLRITDSRGQAVLDKKLQVDALGGGDLDLKLNEKAAVGGYSVRLTRDGRSTTRNFQVQEYRVPTFEVKLSSAEKWSSGPASALVDAKYFHGTAMAGRDLKWTLYGEPETFAPAAFPGYVFTPSTTERTAELAQGEGKLDGSGKAKLEFNASASTGPVRHVLEASVTDVDRQVWTGRLARVVHPTDLYVGIRPPTRGVLSAKDILEVPVVVVTTDQAPRAGVEVDVVLEQVEYASSTRLLAGRGTGWVSSERDNVRSAKEVDRCRVVSTLQAQTCKVTLPAPGSYRVVATARAGARSPQTSFTVSAAGDGVVAWPRFDRERIDVVADQKRYAVGDTARLVVQTPFVSAQGLLTVETGGVLTQRRFEISKDTPALEVPITEAMVPNAFVSVVLLRGRVHDEKDAAGYETGAPAFRLGYARLDVDPGAQRLSVKVGSSETVAKPGSVVQLEVKVADAKGAPTQGAVAIAVVDEAVLGLTAHPTPDPVKELYAARSLAVRTADGRLDLVHSRRSRQEALFPGGDGEDSETFHKILTGDLRHLFKSTAYWNPSVAVGPDGIARVSVTLPDNLTTFRVMAIGFDGHGRAGSGDLKIIVRKALMVQPVLPRFLYPGDTLTVEALAFNGTSKPGELSLSAMSLEGLEPLPGAKLVQTNTVQGGASVKVGIPVRVTGRGKINVRWAATLGRDTDEVQVTVPILDAGAKRVVVASKQFSSTSGEVLVPLPMGRLPGSTEVEVMVSSSSLSELKDSVQYLMEYPNGCIEQTTSTAYPLVVLKDLLPEIGVTVNEADLKKFSEAGVKRLLSFQTTAGGLAYWPGSDTPHIFGTTFGLTALIEAKKRGYAVPDEAMNRAAKYLEAALKQGQITEEMPHAGMPDGDTRALVVLTLNRLGKPQPSYVSTLWTERAKLSAFGVAMLAVTVSEGGGDRSLLEPMLAHVQAESKKDEAEAWFEGARKGGYSMDSPLRTHAASLLAFGSGGTKSEMPAKLLTGLLKRKDGSGGWGNTQENVYGIMGIAKLAGGSGPAPQAELTIGGKQVAMEKLEAVGKGNRRYSVPGAGAGVKDSEAGTVRVGLDKRSGPPTFLTVRARYEVPLTGENRAAFARGFEVKRTYETLEGRSLEGKPIPLGSVVRVRVSLSSQEKRNYVAVDDKLPAGLEPLNASLATTERLELGDATPTTAKGLEVLSFQETRDHRVAFFADELPAGEYQWVYLARATTAGKFIRPPASAEAMYEPQVSGATSIEDVTVVPQ
ncbi:MAG: alpha-2-macroglobulin family protein [Archangium sp.]|nr:alpha-2-macroglobulin family protein [Archangium sp.]